MWDAAALTMPLSRERDELRNAWAADAQSRLGPTVTALGSPFNAARVAAVEVRPVPVPPQPVPVAVMAADRYNAAAPGGEPASVPSLPPPATGPSVRDSLDQASRMPPRRSELSDTSHGEPWEAPDVTPAQQQILTLLHEGRVRVGDVLASRDPHAGRADVRLLLEAVRHLGRQAAPVLMEQAGIAAGSTVGDLDEVQRQQLLEAVSAVIPYWARGR